MEESELEDLFNRACRAARRRAGNASQDEQQRLAVLFRQATTSKPRDAQISRGAQGFGISEEMDAGTAKREYIEMSDMLYPRWRSLPSVGSGPELQTLQVRPLLPHGRPHRLPLEAELVSVVLVLSYLSAAALVFKLLGKGWSFEEAFYFCTVTFTTIGYGDYSPHDSRTVRLVTVLFIWCNVVLVSAILGILGSKVESKIMDLADGLSPRALQHTRTTKVLTGATTVGLFVLVLAAGYCYFEGGSWLDGIYFATVTLSTVGYGSQTPSSARTRAMLCPMLLLGVSAVGDLCGAFSKTIHKELEGVLDIRHHRSRLLISLLALVVATFVGGHAVRELGGESWSRSEAFYFALTTVTTVGYGDYNPESSPGQKLLAIAFIWGSVTLLAVCLTNIGAEVAAFGEAVAAAASRSRVHRERLRRLVSQMAPVLLLLFLQLLGAIVFAHLESWSYVNGLYFTCVTLTTVGYGDLLPSTDAGKRATVMFLLVGVPTTAAVVSSISAACTESLVEKIQSLDE